MDLPSQQVCVGIAGRSAGIQGSPTGRREAQTRRRDVDVSGTSGYGYFESLDKLDGITDEESEFTILILAI